MQSKYCPCIKPIDRVRKHLLPFDNCYYSDDTTTKPETGINLKLDLLPPTQKTKLSVATYCRDMLKELISLTFKVQDVEYLEDFGCFLGLKVKKIKDRMETSGITLEPGSESVGRRKRKVGGKNAKSTLAKAKKPRMMANNNKLTQS